MSGNKSENGRQARPGGKSPLRYVLLAVAVLVTAGGCWVAWQFFVKGEVEISLPNEMAQSLNKNLRLDDGRIGPVRIVPNTPPQNGANRPTPDESDDVAHGRPSASGLIVEQGQSAPDLVPAAEAGAARAKIDSGADAVVTEGFVSDLAEYFASNYWPKGTHAAAVNGPASSAGLAAAGQRYGANLTGFAPMREERRRDLLRERELVLNYIYTPVMIEALSALYVDRFADQLTQAGFKQARGGSLMSTEEVAEMLHFYADYVRSTGAVLAAYGEREEAPELVQRWHQAQEAAILGGTRFQEAQYYMDAARERRDQREISKAAEDLKRAELEYRSLMLARERAAADILGLLNGGRPQSLAEQEVLYVAAWAARRGRGAQQAHLAAAAAGEFIGQVLDEKALELEPGNEEF